MSFKAHCKRFGLWVALCIGASNGCTAGKHTFTADELHLPYSSEVPHMDPARVVTADVSDKVDLLYDGLLEFHYLKRPFTLVANLALDMPTIDLKKNTYTFRLRRGVLFHADPCFGAKLTREMTAYDVEYSFKRLIDAKVGSRAAPLLTEIWEGAKEFYESTKGKTPTNYAKSVAALTVLDPYTIRITLKRPHSVLLYMLVQSDFRIVPKEAVSMYGDTFGTHPVGTGPYRLAKWHRKSKMIFEAHPHYHGRYPKEGMPEDAAAGMLSDVGKQLPITKRLVMFLIPEVEPMWLKFLQGDIDFSSIPRERYSSVVEGGELTADMRKKGIVGTRLQGLISWNMYINLASPYLQNVHLRRAISLALDMPSILQRLYKDKYMPSQSVLPPLLWPTDQGAFPNPYAGPDLDKARKALKNAGYPDGKGLPVFKVATSTGAEYRQWVEAFDLDLKRVGIRVQYEGMNSIQWTKVLTTGQFDMLISGSVGSYPDAEDFLSGAYSKNWPMGGNYSKFINAQYDRWYEDLLRLPIGSRERNATAAKMIRLLQSEVPEIPIFIYNTYTLRYDTIRNYKSNHGLWSLAKYLKKVPIP